MIRSIPRFLGDFDESDCSGSWLICEFALLLLCLEYCLGRVFVAVEDVCQVVGGTAQQLIHRCLAVAEFVTAEWWNKTVIKQFLE